MPPLTYAVTAILVGIGIFLLVVSRWAPARRTFLSHHPHPPAEPPEPGDEYDEFQPNEYDEPQLADNAPASSPAGAESPELGGEHTILDIVKVTSYSGRHILGVATLLLVVAAVVALLVIGVIKHVIPARLAIGIAATMLLLSVLSVCYLRYRSRPEDVVEPEPHRPRSMREHLLSLDGGTVPLWRFSLSIPGKMELDRTYKVIIHLTKDTTWLSRRESAYVAGEQSDYSDAPLPSHPSGEDQIAVTPAGPAFSVEPKTTTIVLHGISKSPPFHAIPTKIGPQILCFELRNAAGRVRQLEAAVEVRRAVFLRTLSLSRRQAMVLEAIGGAVAFIGAVVAIFKALGLFVRP